MSVADSTNRSHQGKKKQALRNAIRSADFRKSRTRKQPLSATEIALAVQKHQQEEKQVFKRKRQARKQLSDRR
jgi:hypothetical protein